MGKRLKVEPAPAFDPGGITERALTDRREVEKPLIVVPKQEADLLTGILAGKSAETACREAGFHLGPTESRRKASITLKRYGDVLIQALEDKGVTIDAVAEGLAGLMQAEKPVVVDKSVEMFPDHGARQRAIDTVLDILPGARAPKTVHSVNVSLEEIIFRIESEENDG